MLTTFAGFGLAAAEFSSSACVQKVQVVPSDEVAISMALASRTPLPYSFWL
jgi:hypothetical protein